MGDAITWQQLAAILGGILAAMGVPTAITGILSYRAKRRMEKHEAEQAAKQEAQEQLLLLLVQMSRSSIALNEATAHAIQRGHANGAMEAALKYAAETKHKLKDFLAKQGIHALLDD